jgi:hypothetical protein
MFRHADFLLLKSRCSQGAFAPGRPLRPLFLFPEHGRLRKRPEPPLHRLIPAIRDPRSLLGLPKACLLRLQPHLQRPQLALLRRALLPYVERHLPSSPSRQRERRLRRVQRGEHGDEQVQRNLPLDVLGDGPAMGRTQRMAAAPIHHPRGARQHPVERLIADDPGRGEQRLGGLVLPGPRGPARRGRGRAARAADHLGWERDGGRRSKQAEWDGDQRGQCDGGRDVERRAAEGAGEPVYGQCAL